ncbi:porin family protein [Bacteroides sp. 519]|uniref:porin family protein n=1 Tax=Bacteroides sp. 519 TaxID=2302937 RepID=UPI0013D841BA|nr:porin family protein [Bacteroides sp. 519]NDV57702.1 hypothetical protein [Bacteroides sp. 519]
MKKVLILFIIISGCFLSASAQFDPRKVTIGGGLGLQFGDYTLINVAPQIGYDLSNKFNVGAGFSYTYYNEKHDYNRLKQTNSYLGFNVYAKFYPIPYIVLMVQPEANRMWRTVEHRDTGDKYSTNKFISSCIVGGGIRLGAMTAMLKYDLGRNSDSPYGTRIFYSIGYTFGFW